MKFKATETFKQVVKLPVRWVLCVCGKVYVRAGRKCEACKGVRK